MSTSSSSKLLYPFPSHVPVQSFVTVKLSDKGMYDLWKTQMLRLLESHNMLGFIINHHDAMDEQWKRSDALVQGWILASLSEEAAKLLLFKSKPHAKDMWNQLQFMFAPPNSQPSSTDGKEVEKLGGEVLDIDDDQLKQELYVAVENERQKQLLTILKDGKLKLTDSISINGNTALHVAVAGGSGRFLKIMLDMLAPEDDVKLTDVRNSDGSTPLHVAALYGNKDGAKMLVERSPELVDAKDKDGCRPLDILLSSPTPYKGTCLLLNYLLTDTKISYVSDERARLGDKPLITAISHGDFELAGSLIEKYNSLENGDVLMAIAQNCPSDFTPYDILVYKLWKTPVRDFIRSTFDIESRRVVDYGYVEAVNLIHRAVFNKLIEKMNRREAAVKLLNDACGLIKSSKNDIRSYPNFYRDAVLEAIREDVSDVIERIVHWFPEATLMVVDEDGNNITQAAWKNRALKVVALIAKKNMAKHTSLFQKIKDDPFGNNFLHFAARLAPPKKLDPIVFPPFKLQRELQWFQNAKKRVPRMCMEKNCFGETPEMVFSKEHKALLSESCEWMKSTANACSVTAILIITIMFAAVITVPGGNDEKAGGYPKFRSEPAFIVFEASTTISMVTSSMSLLLFLAIIGLSGREQLFLITLPLTLIIALVGLFIAATFNMLAFGAALFLMFGGNRPWTLALITPVTVVPILYFFMVYSGLLLDFIASVGQFFGIYSFRKLKILGRIYV